MDTSKELVTIWKNKLDSEEEIIFVKHFQQYNTLESNEFKIDLDQVLDWIGFSRKDHAKRLLEKSF